MSRRSRPSSAPPQRRPPSVASSQTSLQFFQQPQQPHVSVSSGVIFRADEILQKADAAVAPSHEQVAELARCSPLELRRQKVLRSQRSKWALHAKAERALKAVEVAHEHDCRRQQQADRRQELAEQIELNKHLKHLEAEEGSVQDKDRLVVSLKDAAEWFETEKQKGLRKKQQEDDALRQSALAREAAERREQDLRKEWADKVQANVHAAAEEARAKQQAAYDKKVALRREGALDRWERIQQRKSEQARQAAPASEAASAFGVWWESEQAIATRATLKYRRGVARAHEGTQKAPLAQRGNNANHPPPPPPPHITPSASTDELQRPSSACHNRAPPPPRPLSACSQQQRLEDARVSSNTFAGVLARNRRLRESASRQRSYCGGGITTPSTDASAATAHEPSAAGGAWLPIGHQATLNHASHDEYLSVRRDQELARQAQLAAELDRQIAERQSRRLEERRETQAALRKQAEEELASARRRDEKERQAKAERQRKLVAALQQQLVEKTRQYLVSDN